MTQGSDYAVEGVEVPSTPHNFVADDDGSCEYCGHGPRFWAHHTLVADIPRLRDEFAIAEALKRFQQTGNADPLWDEIERYITLRAGFDRHAGALLMYAADNFIKVVRAAELLYGKYGRASPEYRRAYDAYKKGEHVLRTALHELRDSVWGDHERANEKEGA